MCEAGEVRGRAHSTVKHTFLARPDTKYTIVSRDAIAPKIAKVSLDCKRSASPRVEQLTAYT